MRATQHTVLLMILQQFQRYNFVWLAAHDSDNDSPNAIIC